MSTKPNTLHAWLPFLRWFPLTKANLQADIMAGITVALLLVPQSMAYAQLAGLPVVYGLYASLIPVVIASMWGSCHQLHTAPVAMLSMMSAAALIPLAAPGTDAFIALAIMLALMVGVMRFAMGLARLGVLVNFISNPVLIGFTNAAAVIIGLSQLNKVIGVPFPRSDSYLADLWGVVTQFADTHWLTLAFAVGAYLLITLSSRYIKRIPGVLLAVIVTTAISAAIGFEHKETVSLDAVRSADEAAIIRTFDTFATEIKNTTGTIASKNTELLALDQSSKQNSSLAASLQGQLVTLRAELHNLKQENNQRRIDLHHFIFERAESENGEIGYYLRGQAPTNMLIDKRTWRFSTVTDGHAVFSAGGAVVGNIPKGLPSFAVPTLDLASMWLLLPAAFVMALIGFMEATSISRAIAIKTKQNVDVNKELVGQGLANMVGSFFSSYTVSGSFSRSAVAAQAGARTGVFSLVSAFAVVIVLLYLTPLLYHLPQSVLAVIVMMAVFGLIRIRPLLHAWKLDRSGAVIGIITFVSTLAMAPAIANGILVGIVLTMIAFVLRVMKPRVEVLGREEDGTLAGMETYGLAPISQCFVPVRFDGALMFANVAYFENALLKAHAKFPNARTILVIGSGINWLDASGEEKVREMASMLKEAGVTLAFSSLKKQVRISFEKSGLIPVIGKENIFRSKDAALKALAKRHEILNDENQPAACK